MKTSKTILITGAASGIGLATVRLFYINGWKVIAADINQAALKALQTEFGDKIVTVQADVSTRNGASALMAAASSATQGKLDCLFNCAGLLQMGPHSSIDPLLIDRMMDVNIKGVLYCIDAALPLLKNTADAHIVNMSSTSAECGSPDHAVYSASKFFVKGLTEALNIEFEPLGIQVSAIIAPYVNTPMVNNASVKAASVQKLGVKIEANQVAQTVWKAAHGNKVIWRVGMDAVALNLLSRLFGSAAKPIVKKLTGY